MPGFKDETGNKYNMLTVISRAENRKSNTRWNCVCDCGNFTTVMAGNLRYGKVKSCGCIKKLAGGLSNHPLYPVLNAIKRRCYNTKDEFYHIYGGKGITVCDEWKDVAVFIKWAEKNGWKVGLQIDRIDNNGNYCPENCRLVSSLENNHNRPVLRSNNKSGYAGVILMRNKKFQSIIGLSDIMVGSIIVKLGSYESAIDAAKARDRFIITNNLPHKLQVLKREEK